MYKWPMHDVIGGKMSTDYCTEIDIKITGTIEEDVGSRKALMLMAELNLICIKYNLFMENTQVYNEN